MNNIFWDVMPCGLVDTNKLDEPPTSTFRTDCTLKMEEADSFETLVKI
jgi:hypothetical protein